MFPVQVVVPKRAAVLLDRIMVALQKAVDEDTLGPRKVNKYIVVQLSKPHEFLCIVRPEASHIYNSKTHKLIEFCAYVAKFMKRIKNVIYRYL